MPHNKTKTPLVALLVSLLTGCASLGAVIEGINHPQDTAILINGTAYQINTFKCAQIRSIGEDGTLDCYDLEGNKSAEVAPVSEWRRNYLKEQMGIEWASTEHQDFLFYYFHGGGKEQAASAVVSSFQQIRNTRGTIKSLEKSRQIKSEEVQMRMKGTQAYMSGGMSAWHAHQFNVVQWRLDNSRYFLDRMND